MLFCGSLTAQSNGYLMSKVAYENNRYLEAQKLVQNYCSQYPDDKRAKLLNAKIDIELQQYGRALRVLAELKPNVAPDILLLKSRANAALGRNVKAVEQLNKYLLSRKKLPEPIIKSYFEFSNLKTTIQWKELWQKERYTNKEQMLNNIFYAIKTAKYEEANDRLDEFLSKYKTNSYAHYLKSDLLYKNKKYREALKHSTKAVDKNAKDISYKALKARCLTKLGKVKKSISLYNEIIKQDTLYLQAYLGRAAAYMGNNEIDKAENDILKYRAYYPNDKNAQLLNAQINAKGGDFLSAIGNYGQLIKSDPSKSAYFIGRADAYFNTKTYKYAIRDYSMALDLDPKNVYVYKQKALIHKKMGDMKKACIEWKYAAQMGDIESMYNLKKYCK